MVRRLLALGVVFVAGFALPAALTAQQTQEPPPTTTEPTPTTTETTPTTTETTPTTTETTPTTTEPPPDTTPPVVTVPGDISAPATGPGGASVSYSTSATDNDDGSDQDSCSRSSVSTFTLVSTTVSCSATDAAGNTGSASFKVTVADTTPPSLSGASDISASATGPAGANVSYATPTATDAVSGSVPVSCSKASGSTFPLGATTVSCSATDAAGNTGSASFKVTVADTTPPTLSGVPGDATVEATGPSGSTYSYASPTAADTVSGSVPVSCSPASGSNFPLGATTVSCSATDAAGNKKTASFKVVMQFTEPPKKPPPPDPSASSSGSSPSATDPPLPKLPLSTPVSSSDQTRPANVKLVSVRAGDHFVALRWTLPPDPDLDLARVEIIRTGGYPTQAQRTVYRGKATSFTDRRLRNGVPYRYVLLSYDGAGNRSSGVSVVAAPKPSYPAHPADNARVVAPPVLSWRPLAGAAYYNLQLFRGTKKLLSVWPAKPRVALSSTWLFAGIRYRLTPGVYRWYVWPGLGRPAARRYGELLVQETFRLVASKKAKAKRSTSR